MNCILSKQNDKYFSVKGICSASLKQKDRWAFIVIQKSTGDIELATCQCPAGKSGTASYSYAVSKVIVKWVIDRVTIIPQKGPAPQNHVFGLCHKVAVSWKSIIQTI